MMCDVKILSDGSWICLREDLILIKKMFKLIFVLAFATIVFADKPLKIGSILNAPFLIAT